MIFRLLNRLYRFVWIRKQLSDFHWTVKGLSDDVLFLVGMLNNFLHLSVAVGPGFFAMKLTDERNPCLPQLMHSPPHTTVFCSPFGPGIVVYKNATNHVDDPFPLRCYPRSQTICYSMQSGNQLWMLRWNKQETQPKSVQWLTSNFQWICVAELTLSESLEPLSTDSYICPVRCK